MANWAKLQEDTIGLPVFKRAKHGIHFDKGNGEVLANFVGKPCHYQDGGLWKPIDTRPLITADGFYGCAHTDVKVHLDGRVKVAGSDYLQFTKLPGAPVGKLDGDRIIRQFPGGYQELFITEDGFREVITVEKPTFPLEKFIGKASGILPSKYSANLLVAEDADGKTYVFTGDIKSFGDWLDGAKYPVVIDPDFAVSTAYIYLYGNNATYLTARSTVSAGITSTFFRVGQITGFFVLRSVCKFDTSSIGADSTVTQANLKLKDKENNSDTDFDVQIVKTDWSSGTNEQIYDNILANDADDSIFYNTSSYSVNQFHTSGNLSTTWVSKTGTTYYGLRSSRDVAATQPSGNEYVYFYPPTDATEGNRPVLTVLYSAGGAHLKVNMNAQMSNLTGGIHG